MSMDWHAYEEGRYASIEHDSDPAKVENPYPQGSKKWESWNRGWNSHFEKEWSE